MNTQVNTLIIEDLARLASCYPNKAALLDNNGRVVVYSDLLDQIERAHAWLFSLGMRPKDTLIALMPNAIETVILFLASLRGGYIYAPLPCTTTLAEVSRWKHLTHAQFCLLANPVSNILQASLAEMDWKVERISIGDMLFPPAMTSIEPVNGAGLIMASSGSTGEPKAMLIDASRLWASANAFALYHNIENADLRFWNYLPMSYLGGLFNLALIPLALGGSIFIDEAFNGKTFLVFWSTVERFNINSLWLVPSILRGLLSLADRTTKAVHQPKITHCYIGTAPVSLEEKQKFFQVFGIQALENYGLSETTFISSEHLNELALCKEGEVGTIMPGIEIKLVPTIEEETSVCEIWVRTPYMALGYLNEESEVDSMVNQDGFLRTGDFGQILDGRLQLIGRRRDIIKKGGVLIVLREIELLAESHVEVMEAAAVRVEHEFYGDSFDLYVRSCKPMLNHEQFILSFNLWLNEQLVRHKWPEHIVYCDEFPRTTSGKVQKHLLINRAATYV